MYIVRKEPYEQTIPEINKTDGTVIPERKYMTDDRAIFKRKDCDRCYRHAFYPELSKQPYDSVELFVTDDLEEARNIQFRTFEYCGEWFDVYDENGVVTNGNG